MRLFVAAFPPAVVNDELDSVAEQWRTSLDDVRWTRPEHRHLTLAFLGEVRPEIAGEVGSLLGRFRMRQAVEARLGPATGFPRASRARVAVVEVESKGLEILAAELADALRRLGLTLEERAFRPHLTLARLRTPRSLEPVPPVEPIAWLVDRLELVESRLRDPSRRYSTVETVSLAGGSADSARP